MKKSRNNLKIYLPFVKGEAEGWGIAALPVLLLILFAANAGNTCESSIIIHAASKVELAYNLIILWLT